MLVLWISVISAWDRIQVSSLAIFLLNDSNVRGLKSSHKVHSIPLQLYCLAKSTSKTQKAPWIGKPSCIPGSNDYDFVWTSSLGNLGSVGKLDLALSGLFSA